MLYIYIYTKTLFSNGVDRPKFKGKKLGREKSSAHLGRNDLKDLQF